MKQWFKLKYVFLGVVLGVMAILLAEKNVQGTSHVASSIGDLSKWFVTVPGKVIAILVACLFVYQQISFLKNTSDDKKEAIKTVAKNVLLIIGGIISAGLLIGFMGAWVGR